MFEGSKVTIISRDANLFVEGEVHIYTENVLIVTADKKVDLSSLVACPAIVYIYNTMKGKIMLEANIVEIVFSRLILSVTKVVQEIQKREDIRIDFDKAIKITKMVVDTVDLKNFCMMRTIDLSANGVKLVSKLNFPPNTLFHTKIPLDEDTSIPVVLKVLRRKPVENGFTYGCKIVEISNADKSTLRRFVLKTQVKQYKQKKS